MEGGLSPEFRKSIRSCIAKLRIGQTYLIGEKWAILPLRSIFPGHLTGKLTNTAKDIRYGWTFVDGNLYILREPRDASEVPKYVRSVLQDLGEQGVSR